MDMVRMAIEAMYEDTCTVVEHRKTKEKGVVTYTDTVVLENQPCKLSFETIAQAEKTDAASPVAQAVKLFVAPEVEIKSGSKIRDTLWQFHGVHQERRSGDAPDASGNYAGFI